MSNSKALPQNEGDLVILIDGLAPLNNKFRSLKDPLAKIETMWDFGAILDRYLDQKKIKLHELLFKIYDPYSTVKMSYITRDLGSYSYRIYKYFRNREDIRKNLSGLNSYSVFREAIPLLFNPKYKLTDEHKKEVIRTVTSSSPVTKLVADLRLMKKQILPISNPRNQKAKEYETERDYLLGLLNKLKIFYSQNPAYPSKELIDRAFWKAEIRTVFVVVLMALASETFLGKVKGINADLISNEMKELYKIVVSDTQNRARFRKWVMSSNELLKIAEAVYSLGDKDYYKEFRSKFI